MQRKVAYSNSQFETIDVYRARDIYSRNKILKVFGEVVPIQVGDGSTEKVRAVCGLEKYRSYGNDLSQFALNGAENTESSRISSRLSWNRNWKSSRSSPISFFSVSSMPSHLNEEYVTTRTLRSRRNSESDLCIKKKSLLLNLNTDHVPITSNSMSIRRFLTKSRHCIINYLQSKDEESDPVYGSNLQDGLIDKMNERVECHHKCNMDSPHVRSRTSSFDPLLSDALTLSNDRSLADSASLNYKTSFARVPTDHNPCLVPSSSSSLHYLNNTSESINPNSTRKITCLHHSFDEHSDPQEIHLNHQRSMTSNSIEHASPSMEQNLSIFKIPHAPAAADFDYSNLLSPANTTLSLSLSSASSTSPSSASSDDYLYDPGERPKSPLPLQSPISPTSPLDGCGLSIRSTKKLYSILGNNAPLDVSLMEIKRDGLPALLQSKIPLLYFLAALINEYTPEILVRPSFI